jgi:hypothetical protein
LPHVLVGNAAGANLPFDHGLPRLRHLAAIGNLLELVRHLYASFPALRTERSRAHDGGNDQLAPIVRGRRSACSLFLARGHRHLI